jgi:hypothetical protein
VSTTAGPSGFSGGKNYVVYNYFKLNSLTHIGNDQTYSTGTNFAYGACAVNSEGYVGCAMETGTNAPGGLVLVQDATSPSQPWAYDFAVGAVGGASAGGDYVVVNPWNPGVGPFQTVLWRASKPARHCRTTSSGVATARPARTPDGRTPDRARRR